MIFIKEKEYKNNIGIYKIKNIINNKVYIGQTRDRFIERFWNHMWKLNNQIHDNEHLQRAWNKYGEDNFEFSIVKICNQFENIDELEKYYIKIYSDRLISYNISIGGQGKSSPMKLKSKLIIGMKNKINMTGKKHTEETKRKMSLIRKNKIISKKTDVINKEMAFNIKTDLIHKVPYKEIYKKYNIDYKIINNIISNNTWKMVKVNGWDQFINEKPQKLTFKIAEEIREKFKNGISKIELMTEYKKSERTIRDILKYNIYTK